LIQKHLSLHTIALSLHILHLGTEVAMIIFTAPTPIVVMLLLKMVVEVGQKIFINEFLDVCFWDNWDHAN
jgi:hypothetical protein